MSQLTCNIRSSIVRVACAFPSMLLILTVVYLFHGFQTHAAPLTTSLLSESSSNTTVLSTPACICPVDQRSIWDILWSCLATIFACSWVSIHPNIPAPDEPRWRIFLRRLELMFWAVVGPELIITWAFRQWTGARHLENRYKEEGHQWTNTHGYFIQMGGFMLFEGNIAKGVLLPRRFDELLVERKIEFPTVTVKEIEDRSKADGFSKTIALGQTLWFVAQCSARRVQHLDLTLVELLTLSLAALNGVVYFLWWNKPMDVRFPVPVYLLDKPSDPNEPNESNEPNEPNEPNYYDHYYAIRLFRATSKMLIQFNEPFEPDELDMDHFASTRLRYGFFEVYRVITERRQQITTYWQFLPILSKVLILICWTIMIPFFFALTFSILLTLVVGITTLFLFSRWMSILLTDDSDFNIGAMKVPTFYSSPQNGCEAYTMPFFGVVFGGIHCVGWFFIFPSSGEAMLWRISSAILTGTAFIFPLLLSFVLFTYIIGRGLHLSIAVFLINLLIYVVSRLLLIVEAFIALRQLTPGMLALVKWTSFIPHI